ncbi:hypothetical protein [Limosilactobacillus equigenerosi]|uniref:Integral membrane protein n=1 Tax=Limosilactobacillus equigenerosi DSM 18793 = JCM 14505 TaxID=1423742 RepID=A0A0R1UZD8_9LACO|nr:hypothetical protein [Limosilactobacillus equigenerosi]KRL95211.1 hypothetical protein FC21_GL000799 [Limosilactobacillus equigenerosi DSM 18793 = JCM 14505]
MWEQLKLEWQEQNWPEVALSLIALNLSWLIAPFTYLSHHTDKPFATHFTALMIYLIMIGCAMIFTNQRRETSLLALPGLIISVLTVLIGFANLPILMLLMLLLPVYLLLLQLPQISLHNVVGLVTLGILLTLALPAATIYLVAHVLTWSSIVYCLPIMTATWMFFTPLYIKEPKQQSFFITGAWAILIITLLTRPLGIGMLLAVILTLVSWFFLLATRRKPTNLAILTTLQLTIIFGAYCL